MTTAIDSNVLIDLIGEENRFTDAGIRALDAARLVGRLIVCPVVAAEISGHFHSPEELSSALDRMGIAVCEMSGAALHAAGTAYVDYKHRSRAPKERMLADFLVGGHALYQADRLLTRDRGYYRTYFPKLVVLDCRDH